MMQNPNNTAMKHLKILLASLAFFSATAVFADNDRPITFDQLPEPARQFIEQHFGERKVALAKMETDFMKKSYEVIFADGCRIEFDGKGDWKEVACKFSEVPAAVISAPIAEYVQANYPEISVVKIEKERRKYEVKLFNRVELTFDMHFNLIDIDY